MLKQGLNLWFYLPKSRAVRRVSYRPKNNGDAGGLRNGG
jgi:hypothetical protein